jgi:hypothetical protein
MISTLKKCEEIIVTDNLYQILAVDANHTQIIQEANSSEDFKEFLKLIYVVLDKPKENNVNIFSKKDFLKKLKEYLRIQNGKGLYGIC